MMRNVNGPSERPNQRAKPVQGKRLLLGLLLALMFVVGGVFYLGVSGGSTHVPLSKPGIGFTTDPAAAASADASANSGGNVLDAALTRTIADRAVRDALRKRILEGWAAGAEPEVAAAAKQGRFVPAPTGDGGQGMEPSYIQEVVRTEFFPMAKACYGELLSRKDAGGRIEMSFTIVADERLGGIVEDVNVGTDGGIADDKMTTCMRESMSTLAFRPPARGGMVTVVYPIAFANEDSKDE